jgi:hypothetical protein
MRSVGLLDGWPRSSSLLPDPRTTALKSIQSSSGVSGRRRFLDLTSLRSTNAVDLTDLVRPHSTPRDTKSTGLLAPRSHGRCRCWHPRTEKTCKSSDLREMERTGIEPVTSGLQSRLIAPMASCPFGEVPAKRQIPLCRPTGCSGQSLTFLLPPCCHPQTVTRELTSGH